MKKLGHYVTRSIVKFAGCLVAVQWVVNVARLKETRIADRILAGKPLCSRPIGGPVRIGKTILKWVYWISL
jgi:hypothetical protein